MIDAIPPSSSSSQQPIETTQALETWTTEQVLNLAPDAGSAKSGRELAALRKWVSVGRNDQALWGACQGSGTQPYQTQIDFNGPAFRCSCPSRKFPCKHGLGLLLLFVGQPKQVPIEAPPAWVTDWLSSRAKRNQPKSEPKGSDKSPDAKTESNLTGSGTTTASNTPATPVVDPAAQARRVANREAKISKGLDELNRWLCDIARRGLAAILEQPPSVWESMAARMVDAQTPGLARRLRQIASRPATGNNHQERIAEELAQLYLLIEGYRRIDTLPAVLQTDLRTAIGWTQNQEDVLGMAGERANWLVVARTVEQEDRFRTQRIWLQKSQESGDFGELSRAVKSQESRVNSALLLSFAAPGQGFDFNLMVGTEVEGELVFFPSVYPQRALLKHPYTTKAVSSETTLLRTGTSSLHAAGLLWAEALACLPWLEQISLTLEQIRPYQDQEGWWIGDQEGNRWPISPRFERIWQFLALSRGNLLTVAGEWDGYTFMPLTAIVDGRWVEFGLLEK